MKLIAILGAGALAAGSMIVAVAPAWAQRYGYDDGRGRYDQRHDGRDRDWRDDRRRDWNGDRGWNGNRGWHRGWDRPRTRVVCRWERTYYGRERRCFNVYR